VLGNRPLVEQFVGWGATRFDDAGEQGGRNP
jgi:hypothetical protein